ncbi:hypothetical protein PF004_g22941 [Phytophthora fragariae]|uniref:Uncharacterized protein n=1 Tax=Phytophthora fragariae TaxID=53985 RepID=A0A6A3I8Z9_9STRA|nr:hypothetical protein PF011_g22828 [Phytophthora fragariae]KAE9186935.1 hypothetical protein PF004_g22941 [Phytophthora fragariae]
MALRQNGKPADVTAHHPRRSPPVRSKQPVILPRRSKPRSKPAQKMQPASRRRRSKLVRKVPVGKVMSSMELAHISRKASLSEEEPNEQVSDDAEDDDEGVSLMLTQKEGSAEIADLLSTDGAAVTEQHDTGQSGPRY